MLPRANKIQHMPAQEGCISALTITSQHDANCMSWHLLHDSFTQGNTKTVQRDHAIISRYIIPFLYSMIMLVSVYTYEQHETLSYSLLSQMTTYYFLFPMTMSYLQQKSERDAVVASALRHGKFYDSEIS